MNSRIPPADRSNDGQTTPPTTEQMMMAILHTLQATLAPKREKIDVQPFDGSDYSLYPQFESALQAKFAIETVSFASEAAMVWWALGKLKDKAARVMNP